MKRRTLISLPLLAAMPRLALAQEEETTTAPDAAATERTESVGTILDDATRYDALKSVVVARDGEIIEARGYRGNDPDTPTNIKSASKSVMSALVGIAIDKGVLEGADQKIAPILEADMPDDPDPRMADITIGNLLSMQAGLGRTSGPNYGRWVASRNWVRAALAMPFDGDPGGRMLYSTGSTHLLSAILTRASGRSTRELAREWLEEPLDGFRIGGWERDPQGIYLGGNQMAMSARSLLVFGELYRNRGMAGDARVLSSEWIDESWTRRTASVFSGDGYGYGWFLRRIGGEDMRYAWGYGGQMLYIAPEIGLTIAMTSEESNPSARNGYRDVLHGLAGRIAAATRSA